MNRGFRIVSSLSFFLLLVFVLPSLSHAAYGIQSVTNLGATVVQMVFAPDGRLFFTDKCSGLKVRSTNGSISTFRSFPVVSPVDSCFSEKGVLGVELDPEFGKNTGNDWLYVYYSVDPNNNRAVRFKSSSDTLQTLITIPTGNAGNHNGGAIHFGNDGKLYISSGDGHQGSPAQSDSSLLGKILRINKDGSIPSDNPQGNAIWAKGFRNPFTFAVHPTNGKIYVNDVGEGAIEEINQLTKGANYGWPTCEGSCGTSGMTNPLYQYYHAGAGGRNSPDGESITGGAFWNGKYFFSDFAGTWSGTYTNGWIGVRNESTNATQIQILPFDSPVAMAVNPADNQLYVTGIGGQLSRITDTDAPPVITSTPPTTPTSTPLPNKAPSITITTPTSSLLYSAGDTIAASATASDPEDGTLSGANIQWKVDFYHYNVLPENFHVHPYLDWSQLTKSNNMSFQISRINEFVSSVWYRITARATDSKGLTTDTFVDIKPIVVTQTFTSSPPGLKLSVNGIDQTTPYTTSTVAGLQFNLLASSPQALLTSNYNFFSWLDNNSTTNSRTYIIPKNPTVISAQFAPTTNTPIPTTPPVATPTTSPSPTKTPDILESVLGFNTIGDQEDRYNANYLTGTKITTGTGNPVMTKASVYVGTVDVSPNNKFQISLYSDLSNLPSTLLAKSTVGTLSANSWNTVDLPFTLEPNKNYWLFYATNTTSPDKNNMKYQLTANAPSAFSATAVTYGNWPAFTSSIRVPAKYSLYALVTGQQSVTPTISPTSPPANTPQPTNPQSTSTPSNDSTYTIYTDSLTSGWEAWSWNGSVNTSSLNQYGNNSISLTPTSSDSGLYLRKTSGSGISGNNYKYVEFSMKSGPSTPLNIRVMAYGSSTNPPLNNGVYLSNYGGNPPTDTYRKYRIPLSALGASDQTIYGLAFQEQNSPSAIFFVDSISFVSDTPSSQIYSNSLSSGWEAWNWSARINTSSLNQYGNNSISVTPNATDAGLYLRKTSGTGISGANTLQFKMKSGGSRPQNIRIFLYGSNTNPPLNSGLSLSSAGGNPPTDTYQTYNIPLSQLSASGQTIYGVAFQILDSQPAIVYIDDINLLP